jgi:hypothetical protein
VHEQSLRLMLDVDAKEDEIMSPRRAASPTQRDLKLFCD